MECATEGKVESYSVDSEWKVISVFVDMERISRSGRTYIQVTIYNTVIHLEYNYAHLNFSEY